MRRHVLLSLSLTTVLVGSVVQVQESRVSAASTVVRGVYKLVDVDPENNANRFSTERIDLRIVRNEAFDSLVDATKIVGAATDGDRGGDFDASSGCALVSTDLWCWGINNRGRLGDGTTTSSPTPKIVLSGVKDFFTSTRYTCAVKINGDLVCAGGSPSASPVITSFSAPIATGVTAINDGGWPCITRTDGHLLCAGRFRGPWGQADDFVPASWTWEDTGLLSSGEIVQGSVTPPYLGPGGSFNAWELDRVVCALSNGVVSCSMMTTNTRTTYIPTFTASTVIAGATDVTHLFVLGQGFGSSAGLFYAYSGGLLYRADRPIGSGIPATFLPVGSMEVPIGMIPTPMGVSSTGNPGFLFESGIATLGFDPIAKFGSSTSTASNSIVRVTAQSGLSQIIPMEVSTGARSTRSRAKVRIVTGGQPVVGAKVAWKSADLAGSELSNVPSATDINGWIDLPEIATGPVTFEVSGGVSGPAYLSRARATVVVNESGDIEVSIASLPSMEAHTLTVTTRDGRPVPSAVVTMVNLMKTNQTRATSNGAAAWATSQPVEGYYFGTKCPHCFAPQISLITGEDGKVTFEVFRTTQRWPYLNPTTRTYEGVDFVVSYNDGVVNVEAKGVLEGSNQDVPLNLESSAVVVGAREVAMSRKNGASIVLRGTTAGLVTEEICDVMVTGGLWSNTVRFNQRSCSNGAVKKSSLSASSARGIACSGSGAGTPKGRVKICPTRSMYVRMRVPGKAGTLGVCVMVAGKPCVTKRSIAHGVPRIVQSGKSLSLKTLVSVPRKSTMTAAVAASSRSRCEVKSGRLLAKKSSVGVCSISITLRSGNRVVVYSKNVWVVR